MPAASACALLKNKEKTRGIVAQASSLPELVAPFRTLTLKAKDQSDAAYADVTFEVGRGTPLASGGDGLTVKLPVGGKVNVRATRFGFQGAAEEKTVGASDTELVATLRKFSITVKDASNGQTIADGAWRLLVNGFEQAHKNDGRLEDPYLALPPNTTVTLEGFKWNCVKRIAPKITSATNNIDLAVDLTDLTRISHQKE